jgi:hypothetical protein
MEYRADPPELVARATLGDDQGLTKGRSCRYTTEETVQHMDENGTRLISESESVASCF